ncbi:MAG TPA: hypothetical protein VF928_11940 [Usitatibacteraceae bacterium]
MKKLVLAFLSVFLSFSAAADCPGGAPCETVNVYKVQSWPTIWQDAKGRELISLREANATDLKSFSAALTSMAKSSALAIRYNVTRIVDKPDDYCNCNLELKDKGCGPKTSLTDMKTCTRICRLDTKECNVAGKTSKDGGGFWYAFPDKTRLTGSANESWKRNAFKVDKNARDWSENSRIIKKASCFADELTKSPAASIDALFENEKPCPALSEAELLKESAAFVSAK